MNNYQTRFIDVEGQTLAYRMSGEGPTLVLLHGIASASSTWRFVMPRLAEHYTVIAPELLGQGRSPRGSVDCSATAQCTALVGLFSALEIERATLVGHSLGGGLAMQLAVRAAELVERLVLVAAGGLGRDVHPLFRVLTMPGLEHAAPFVFTPMLRVTGEAIGSILQRLGWRPSAGTWEFWQNVASLTTRDSACPFLTTLRSTVDLAGQRMGAAEHLDVLLQFPTLILWGGSDRLIPVAHAHAAHKAMPKSRLEVAADAGHFVPVERPDWVVDQVVTFVSATSPAQSTLRLRSHVPATNTQARPRSSSWGL